MGLKSGDRSFTCIDVSAQIEDYAFNEKVGVCIFLFRLQIVLTSHKIQGTPCICKENKNV